MMVEYNSRYEELGFYVDGNFCRFLNGRYVTEDKKEIEVLDRLTDAVRVDTPAPEVVDEVTEEKPSRKASAK